MTRSRRRLAAGFASVALSATAVLTASSAQATPDGDATSAGSDLDFIGSNVSVTLVEAGQTTTCAQFDLHGETVDQPGAGDPLARFDDFTVAECANPTAGAVTVEPAGVWDFMITGAQSGSVSSAQLNDMSLFIDVSGCSFHVAGSADGTYDDASGVFNPTASTLVISDAPVGFLCPVLGVAQGQSVEVDGSWQSDPPIVMTNP